MVAAVIRSRAPIQGLYKFQVRVLCGLGFGSSLSVTETYYQIQNLPMGMSATYLLPSLDMNISLPLKATVAGPSSWSDEFAADNFVNAFGGVVRVSQAAVAAVGGYSVSQMEWLTGPAAGITANCTGWITGLAGGITISHGQLTYCEPSDVRRAGGKFGGL